MIKRIDRYILRKIAVPLSATLGVAALLLLLERMLRLFDFVVNQGGPVDVVWRMLGNLLPHYLGLALPIGLFLGILLAFRNLSLNSEFDALRASGLGLSRLVRPAMGLSIFLLIVNLILVGFVQPHSRYAYRQLVFDLTSGALGASMKVGQYVQLPDNFTIRVEESRDNGEELIGIFAERRMTNGRRIAVTAKRGSFFSTNNQQHVILRLYDGVLVDLNERQQKPRVLTFDVQDLQIDLPQLQAFRDRGDEKLEYTFPELFHEMNDPEHSADERMALQANFHWRVVHVLTFLVLPFLASSLGIVNLRADNSVGIVVGIGTLIVFNELLEAGQALAATGELSPYIGLWGLFAAFSAFSIWMFRVAAFRVGGEPLRGLFAIWAWLRIPIDRMIARFTKEMT